jgi:hypothetical protein
MNTPVLAGTAAGAVDLNQPGTYLHWSIFTVSVANLALIGVMVIIFGAALLIPFPRGRTFPPEPVADPATGGPVIRPGTSTPPATTGGDGTAPAGSDGTAPASRAATGDDSAMWTYKVRQFALRWLPPGKLLPDRQPAYVASWVYVFGVASLAALAVAIISGFVIALGGVDWWHYNAFGHFFNSLHLWSVELFMALIVIHLWGKFWMAAWRGRRAMTWMTGVAAFMASVVECFTGYLSQQNFDSQWISTSAKDAFNSVGIGAFWNAMNFGQMLLWHVVLVPIALVAIVGAHILLVRVRGVSHPLPRPGTYRGTWRERRRAQRAADAAPWRGRTRRYDILKEGTIASVIVLAVTFALAGILSSPDVPPVSVQSWARIAPANFLATSATELNGTSGTATYGPPYNNGTGSVQSLLGSPQQAAGVQQPVNAAQDFVLGPLARLAPDDPAVARALATYRAAPAAQQMAWVNAYAKAVTKVRFTNGTPVVPAAADGPVPVMLAGELSMARSGSLDTDLLAQRQFYGTNFTKPLLFLEDGAYFANKAAAMNLTGEQWGVMNETGSYPGQPWLWLYTLWYQVPRFAQSANVDMIAIYLTGIATILLLAVPFIPGLRDIPRWIPVHRLIWRRPEEAMAGPPPGPQSGPGEPGSAGPAGRHGAARDLGSRR